MPVYSFSCPSEGCGEHKEVFHWVRPEGGPTPPTCETHILPMERDWMVEHGGHKPSSVFPFMHPHLTGDGTPVEIKSEAHYQEMCKHYSRLRFDGREDCITPRADKAFIDDRVETGADGLRKTVQGSGLGHPGAWTGVPLLLTQTQDEINKFFERNSG